jgi:hypothetical protein
LLGEQAQPPIGLAAARRSSTVELTEAGDGPVGCGGGRLVPPSARIAKRLRPIS